MDNLNEHIEDSIRHYKALREHLESLPYYSRGCTIISQLKIEDQVLIRKIRVR